MAAPPLTCAHKQHACTNMQTRNVGGLRIASTSAGLSGRVSIGRLTNQKPMGDLCNTEKSSNCVPVVGDKPRPDLDHRCCNCGPHNTMPAGHFAHGSIRAGLWGQPAKDSTTAGPQEEVMPLTTSETNIFAQPMLLTRTGTWLTGTIK